MAAPVSTRPTPGYTDYSVPGFSLFSDDFNAEMQRHIRESLAASAEARPPAPLTGRGTPPPPLRRVAPPPPIRIPHDSPPPGLPPRHHRRGGRGPRHTPSPRGAAGAPPATPPSAFTPAATPPPYLRGGAQPFYPIANPDRPRFPPGVYYVLPHQTGPAPRATPPSPGYPYTVPPTGGTY